MTILIMIAGLAVIHGLRAHVFSYETNLETILQFSFIPARYDNAMFIEFSPAARWWTPLTYSFLHANWTHFLVNGLWLLVFGAVVARRLGPVRFLGLCIAGSLGGAAAHYLTNMGSTIPTVGASAVVSACVGASTRFAFQSTMGISELDNHRPRLSLTQTFTNRQTFAFIGIWFLVNYLSGVGFSELSADGGGIAWEAHIGGFVAGLLLFAVFDPVKPGGNDWVHSPDQAA